MTSTANSSTSSYDSESEMLSLQTCAGIISEVKNCEVTTLFPYKVMETVYSLRMEVVMYINECWAVCA